MALTHSDAVVVRRVKGKGRGVFARRPILEGEVIERVPVLVISVDSMKDPAAWAGLSRYAYLWGRGTVALALGYGSIYNHSYRPNARYEDLPGQVKLYSALRDIHPGEEITVNYNGDPDDRSPVDFAVVESDGPGEPPA